MSRLLQELAMHYARRGEVPSEPTLGEIWDAGDFGASSLGDVSWTELKQLRMMTESLIDADRYVKA